MGRDAPAGDDLLRDAADPVEAARQHIASTALRDSGPGPGRVGLELEMHLVDLADPLRRPGWHEVQDLVRGLPVLPSASPVTLEPGGQVELSTPPADDVVAAVAALRLDEDVLRRHLRGLGFGLAPLGTDPARPARRTNPGARYAAMEQHFDVLSTGGAGLQMMTATAALQVNVDAGPTAGWAARLDLVRSLVPVLLTASSTSPHLGGTTSGWHSMRQGTWMGIDHGRTDPVDAGEPTHAWADYALRAPVMLVRDGERMTPLLERLTFADWLRGEGPVQRPPTLADLDYHLSTLFPPMRPRGYVEIRCLDAMPDRWWPALAALTVTLLDDPVAADLAAEACEPVTGAWEAAARHGIRDAAVGRAVATCLAVGAERAPAPLRPAVERLAALVASGRTPSDEIRSRIEAVGAARVLAEESEETEHHDD